MIRLAWSSSLLALAIIAAPASAQDEASAPVGVPGSAIDEYLTNDDFGPDSVQIEKRECTDAERDLEYLRTGVRTVNCERALPFIVPQGQRARAASTPAPRAERARVATPTRTQARQAPVARRASSPAPVYIAPNCVPTTKGALNMCLTFALNSAELTAGGRKQVQEFAESFKRTGTTGRFTIAGHTDSLGSSEQNCELSRRRAASVVAYMVELGVPAGQLNPVGYGFSRPQPNTRASDPSNRRVEIIKADQQGEAAAPACS